MNSKTNPLVSVLMTAYNREKYIAEAIESVLASTYTNFELIIVDDCSKDNTVKIANEYAEKDGRVKVYINEKNLGDYPNRNKAASYAKGKYLKYLDSDDIIYSHGLEIMLRSIEGFPGAGFGLASTKDSNQPFPVLLSPAQIYREHFNGFGHFDRAPGSSIILRRAFENMNGFSGENYIGDQEFWFRMGRYYNMVKFPFDLYWSRSHDSQEIKYEHLKYKYYQSLRNDIVTQSLKHQDVPLDRTEITKIKSNLRKRQIVNNLIQFLKRL